MTDVVRRLLPLAVLLLASACGTLRPETPAQSQVRRVQETKPAYNLAGYPPAARDGYIDGCESAKKSRYAKKDAGRMASDTQYQMGWNDGFGICGKK